MMTAEMSPYEGALAAQWLGLETVLPCHYIDPDDQDVARLPAPPRGPRRQGRARAGFDRPEARRERSKSRPAAAASGSPPEERTYGSRGFRRPARDSHGHAPAPRARHRRGADRGTAPPGVCAGDLYIYQRHQPLRFLSAGRRARDRRHGRRSSGRTPTGPRIGSPVVVEPFIGCGHCYPCRIGKSNCCANLQIIGVHRDGGFADYVVAPVDRLHPMPAGLSPFKASFAEPVAIGVQACRRGMVSGDDTVLILGAGPIGLALVEVARARGAKVFITDIDAARLATAAELGGNTACRRRRPARRGDAAHRRRGHAGRHRGDRKPEGDGIDRRSRRRRRPHRHRRPGQEGHHGRLPRPRFHPQGNDHRRLARKRRLLPGKPRR